jgi:hypothetical protein
MLDTKKSLKKYILATIFCLAFSVLYNKFGNRIESIYILYMFVIPIIGGLLSLISKNFTYRNLLACSTLTFILTAFIKGVSEMFGVSTIYLTVLLILSIVLFVISLFFITQNSN